jgi:hypothetical protein
VIVESNRQCGLSCAKWTGDRVRPAAALHPRDGDRMAGTQNRMLVAHQVEVAQAIELFVIGYTGRAIAETDLGPNIKADLGSAVSRLTQECFALTPSPRSRPGHRPAFWYPQDKLLPVTLSARLPSPTNRDPSLRADSVEKVGRSTRPIFSAPWVRFSDADAGGGLIIRLRVNGGSSKSICGGN